MRRFAETAAFCLATAVGVALLAVVSYLAVMYVFVVVKVLFLHGPISTE